MSKTLVKEIIVLSILIVLSVNLINIYISYTDLANDKEKMIDYWGEKIEYKVAVVHSGIGYLLYLVRENASFREIEHVAGEIALNSLAVVEILEFHLRYGDLEEDTREKYLILYRVFNRLWKIFSSLHGSTEYEFMDYITSTNSTLREIAHLLWDAFKHRTVDKIPLDILNRLDSETAKLYDLAYERQMV